MSNRSIHMAAIIVVGAIVCALPSVADVIKLRTNCTGETGLCETTMADVLDEIHAPGSGRALPSSSNAVVVDIGPGTFSLASTNWKYCQPVGSTFLSHLTFRGAGEQATVLTGGGFDPYEPALDDGGDRVVAIENCDDVEFRELTIRSAPGIPAGVEFAGDGETYWNNVTIEAETYGWYDSSSSSRSDSVHWCGTAP